MVKKRLHVWSHVITQAVRWLHFLSDHLRGGNSPQLCFDSVNRAVDDSGWTWNKSGPARWWSPYTTWEDKRGAEQPVSVLLNAGRGGSVGRGSSLCSGGFALSPVHMVWHTPKQHTSQWRFGRGGNFLLFLWERRFCSLPSVSQEQMCANMFQWIVFSHRSWRPHCNLSAAPFSLSRLVTHNGDWNKTNKQKTQNTNLHSSILKGGFT